MDSPAITPASESRWRRLARSSGVRGIVLVIVMGWLLVLALDAVGGAAGLRERYGASIVAVLIPVQAVVAVSPLPSEVLVAANSAIFGFWSGAMMGWAGWMMAAFLQYGLVRRTAKDFDFDVVRARLPERIGRLPIDHPGFLIVGRWLPAGSHIVNSAAGAFGVPLWRHAWTSALSLVPMALVVAGVGRWIVEWWSA